MAWSRKHESCVACHSSRRPHLARGFCNACYGRRKNGHRVSSAADNGAAEKLTSVAESSFDDIEKTVSGFRSAMQQLQETNHRLATKLARLRLLAMEILCACPEPDGGRREVSQDCKVHYDKVFA